jgi:hypothetical protein
MMKGLYVLFIFIITLSSCKEVLTEDLPEIEPKIVVECHLTNEYASSGWVIVSTTSNLYESEDSLSYVDNANVFLSDNFGRIDTLEYHGNGVYNYRSNRRVYVRSLYTYTLKVQVKGNSYAAVSTMPRLTKIDSLGFTYYPDKVLAHEKGYYPIVYFTDNPNEKNYYKLQFEGATTTTNLVQSDILIISDHAGYGNVIAFDSPYAYQENDKVIVNLYSITKETYDFYFALRQQQTNDGGFFSSPPANVPSNFSNGALGLFETSVVDTLSIGFH